MRFFIDTANVDEIREANDMGIIAGVTTNPSLIAKEGRDYMETLKEITEIVDGPISGEVKASTTDAEGMIAEGREIAKLHKNMVVKIPMTTGIDLAIIKTALGQPFKIWRQLAVLERCRSRDEPGTVRNVLAEDIGVTKIGILIGKILPQLPTRP